MAALAHPSPIIIRSRHRQRGIGEYIIKETIRTSLDGECKVRSLIRSATRESARYVRKPDGAIENAVGDRGDKLQIAGTGDCIERDRCWRRGIRRGNHALRKEGVVGITPKIYLR